jgi:hypothetical protein
MSYGGLGLDFGIDSGAIANQVIDSVWPKIDAKINEIVPTITSAALGEIKKEIPKPVLFGVAAAASIVTIAAALDLWDRYKKAK